MKKCVFFSKTLVEFRKIAFDLICKKKKVPFINNREKIMWLHLNQWSVRNVN